MRRLALPTINGVVLYQQSIGQTQKNADRKVLSDTGPDLLATWTAYSLAANQGILGGYPKLVLPDDAASLVDKLYEARLRSKSGVSRWAYDALLGGSPICPYCGFGEVYQLDHFLSQKDYPELNICPVNLVPSCGRCNLLKLDIPPKSADEYLIHPYFDTLPSFQWLFATLDFSSGGPVLEYRVVLPGGHEAIALRLKHQFDLLKLGKRFRDRSAVVLMEIQAMLSAHAQLLGPEGMAEHFRGEGERMHGLHGNCIESAAYFGAAENEVYCAGLIAN